MVSTDEACNASIDLPDRWPRGLLVRDRMERQDPVFVDARCLNPQSKGFMHISASS
jgi:hypothetical protein